VTNESFMAILKKRRSIRRFKDEPVPAEVVRSLIEAATWAPSAGNRQNWEFTVVTSSELKKKMAESVCGKWKQALAKPGMAVVADKVQEYSKHFDWFSEAPVVIVMSARSPELFMTEMFGQGAVDVAGTKTSVAMAAENLMLAAHASGLGSCCLTAPLAADEEMKDLVGLGARRVIVCVIALGYADEEPAATTRKPVDSVTRFVE
jgi:coenzyme F420-0:L-glutamate ligase/coenzyme F420-1:gamma-L-glutamate ligase